MNTKEIKIGLCEGRHEIPEVTEYIFPKDFFNESNTMFDFDRMTKRIHEVLKYKVLEEESSVTLYVTGFTPALVEVINYCERNLIELKLMHFNRETSEYVPQETFTNYWLNDMNGAGFTYVNLNQ